MTLNIPSNTALDNRFWDFCGISQLYPVHSANLTPIQPTWSAYPYHLVFVKKTSDVALLSAIALTAFKCIASASITQGALVCFDLTVHWWRHITHYDVTEVYHALRNVLTVHLNNGATRADLRNPNIVEWRWKQAVNRQYTDDFDAIFFIINPYLYSGFLWARCSPWDIQQWIGPSTPGLHLTGDVSSLDRRRHTSMGK